MMVCPLSTHPVVIWCEKDKFLKALENDTNLQQYVSDVGLGQVVVWFDPVVMSKQKTWVIS